MPATVEDLAFELSRAAIKRQERSLAELRSRASTILAAASIAGSFLAGQALAGGHLDRFGVAAVLVYLSCVATNLYVLLPHELVLEFDGTVALAAADLAHADVADVQRRAVGWLDEFHSANARTLQRLRFWYSTACVALGAEVALWIAGYAGTIL